MITFLRKHAVALLSLSLTAALCVLQAHFTHVQTLVVNGHVLPVQMAAGNFIFTNWLTMKGLQLLVNRLECAKFANTDYGKDYEQDFAVGQTVTIGLPNRGQIRNGLGYSPTPINRLSTTVSCNQIFGYDLEWDSIEEALYMEREDAEIERMYIEPAMAQIQQEIDSRFAQFAYQNTPNIVGTLGTDPTSFQSYSSAARQRMVEMAGWQTAKGASERGMIIAPSVNTSLKAAAITYFNPTDEISEQYQEGAIGLADGFEWHESMSLYSHTAGTSTTPTVKGGGQSGNTLTINATLGDTFNVGDVYGIGAVYNTNPMTRRRTNSAYVRTVCITQALVAAGGGVDVITFTPTLYGPGSPYQNMDAFPLDGATLTLFPGTTSPNAKSGTQSLALTRDAFALVGVKLANPKACEISSYARDPDTGISVSFVRMFDPVQRKMINRWDVLMGFGILYNDSCSVRGLGA